jgi:hypothetical protein
MLASVRSEVPVMTIDHGQTGTHVTREIECRDAGTKREGRKGVPEIVDPPQRHNAHRLLGGSPLERAEVVDVEVAASLTGKQKRRAVAGLDPVERIEGASLQFGILSSPRVNERRTKTTRSSRSTSRFSRAIHSAGRSPVAAANRIIGPYRGPIAPAIASSSAQDSNGCCSLRRRTGLSTPTFAGSTSSPRPRPVKDLAERLGCLEAVAG